MWQKTHTVTADNIQAEKIWQIWSDINRRADWDLDTEWAKISGPFEAGAIFKFKPKGGPVITMEITESIPNQTFTDCYKFPCRKIALAKLYGIHHMEKTATGLKISTTIKIVGVLGFLLRKIIGEKIVAELPEQTEMLLKLAREIKI